MQDSYKAVPAAKRDWRLQGFYWLGRYFIELKKVFGSKEAVSAFDRLNHTLVVLAATAAKLPLSFIHRTLDDVPVVTPAWSEKGETFADSYESICSQIGASLAPPCPDFEKSFKDSTRGTVLGIQFDTSTLTWSISQEKKDRILMRIEGFLMGNHINLLDVQRLIGSLNDLGQMCPFLRGFRQPIHTLLTSFHDDEDTLLPVPHVVRQDLHVWAAAVQSASLGFPIPRRPAAHLPSAICFASDASGAQFNKADGRFITLPYEGSRGAASINIVENDIVWFHAQVIFPRPFLLSHRDDSDHAYGCKSATLESIGLILPFVCCPELLINKEVTLFTDNEALVYGWDKRRVAHDNTASIFLKGLHLISTFLGTSVEVRHLPRMSSPSAILVDALTRSTTTNQDHLNLIGSAQKSIIPPCILSFLEDPSEDLSLPYALLNHVENMFLE
jgi:hypothetical protein